MAQLYDNMTLYDLPTEIRAHILSYLADIHAIMARCAWAGFADLVKIRIQSPDICRAIVNANDLRFLKIVCSQGAEMGDDLYYIACAANSIDCQQFLISIQYPAPYCYETIGHSASVEFIENFENAIDYLPAHYPTDLIIGAMSADNVNILRHVMRKYSNALVALPPKKIGAFCHSKGLEFMQSKGIWVISSIVARAAYKHNNVECLTFLHERGFVFQSNIFSNVWDRGRVTTLATLHKLGCPLVPEMILDAVSANKFKMVDWLIGQNCPTNTGMRIAAIAKSYVPLLAWLFEEKGHEMTSQHMDAAIRHGSRSVIKYLFGRKCPLSANIDEIVVRNRSVGYINLAPKYGYVLSPRLYELAAGIHDTALFIHLHNVNCEWGDNTLVAVARTGNFACFTYAYINGAPGNLRDCAAAIFGQHQGDDITKIGVLSKGEADILAFILKSHMGL